MEALELIKLTKIFKHAAGDVYALRDVDLKVSEGSAIAIIGPSGSGKSTLLNMIGCLDKPTEGEVMVNNIPTSRMSDNEVTALRRDKIGFIFQAYNLIPSLTGLENIELPLYLKGIGVDVREKKISEIVEKLYIDEKLLSHRPNELSGGQQQRIAIARALANDPYILLGDEPTGNLDSATGEAVMSTIKLLNKELGKTVIVVTHDKKISDSMDSAVYLKDGRIVGG